MTDELSMTKLSSPTMIWFKF